MNKHRWNTPESETAHAQHSVFNRMGDPSDFADIIAFLASDTAAGSPAKPSTRPAARTSEHNRAAAPPFVHEL